MTNILNVAISGTVNIVIISDTQCINSIQSHIVIFTDLINVVNGYYTVN